jgi:hypothetical protein
MLGAYRAYADYEGMAQLTRTLHQTAAPRCVRICNTSTFVKDFTPGLIPADPTAPRHCGSGQEMGSHPPPLSRHGLLRGLLRAG